MSWLDACRLLCVRLDTIGDVLMTTPALRAIKETHPDRHVTLLTSSSGALAGRLVPEVDEVLVHDAPWLESTAPSHDGAAELALAADLRERGFDAAVIFTVYSQSCLPAALLLHLADIPLRLAHCRENPYRLLTHWVAESEPQGGIRHEVRRQLDLVASVGLRPSHELLSLRPAPQDWFRAAIELQRLGLGASPWVVVHPGATAASRRYPPELFARVVRALVRYYQVEVVLTGSADEAGLVTEIAERAGVRTHSLVGRLSLGALAALIARAPVLISNNSGPAHVAAAMGTPVVDLYALTNPQHTPWAVEARVLNHPVPCAPCHRSVCPQRHHLCLRGVPPGDVVQATLELLRTSSSCRASTS
jgi:lipopolysaccharide heptosyltransferase II